MDGDKFISTSKNIPTEPNPADDNNFFLQQETGSVSKIMQTEPSRHINDYDFNILKEDAYKDVSDEVFKLEYKIAKTEEQIKTINQQIQLAKDIRDSYEYERLNSRKLQLERDLYVLTDLYNEASLSAKLSSGLTSKIKDKFINTGNFIENLGKFILSKMPGKIASIIAIKKSLDKLENINKSVDELMKGKYPYGEASDRYNRLSKYIARANSIQSEIYKFMK